MLTVTKMTKKHYEAIASVLNTHTQKVAREIALELSNYFASDNIAFKSEMFLTACGYPFMECPDCGSKVDPEYNCCYSNKCEYMR